MNDDQADEQSLEERIAAPYMQDGEDDELDDENEVEDSDEESAEDDEEGDDSPAEGAELEEVEYEGRTYQLPKELKDALLRQSDYTTKTQALADQSRAVAARDAQIKAAEQSFAFQNSIAEELQQLQMLDFQLKQFEQLPWAELSSDEMIRNKLAMDQLERSKREMQGKLGEKHRAFQSQQRQAQEAALTQAREALQKAIPGGYSDDVAKAIAEYAVSSGYSPEQVQSIQNPTDVLVLWKASQYDRLRAEKDGAVRRAAKAPPVVKPGSSNPMPQGVKNRLNFRKAIKGAQSSQDKARLIEQQLAREFGG